MASQKMKPNLQLGLCPTPLSSAGSVWRSLSPAWGSSHLRDTATNPLSSAGSVWRSLSCLGQFWPQDTATAWLWSCLWTPRGGQVKTVLRISMSKNWDVLAWVESKGLENKLSLWETLNSWFLLEFITYAICKGYYGQMFQQNLVLLLVVFGPLRSHVLPPLADMPHEFSQLPFCFSSIFVCVILKLFPLSLPAFLLILSLCLPRDLLLSAPYCPSK